MGRGRRRALGVAVGLIGLALACVGPVIILPPPNQPDAVDTALAGYATYCGRLPAGDGADATVLLFNVTRSSPLWRARVPGAGPANACGCYEGITVPAEPGDEIELLYRGTDGSFSQSVFFNADLGGGAPAACTPCAEVCP